VSYAFDHLSLIAEAIKQSPFGLITDVDGTISQIAPTPKQAKVSPLCRQYLSTLCNPLTLVAAVSGRSAVEVRNMVKIDGMVYIGNHGMERWTESHPEHTREAKDYVKLIKAAIEELKPLLSIEGIYIEDKGLTATIHYRLSPEPQSTEKYMLSLFEKSPQLKQLRIVPGRMVIDLLPPVDVNKGTAVFDLIREFDLKSGIYLGDDLTDIDAFRAIHTASPDLDFRGLAFGITSQEMPDELLKEVDFTLNGVSDVERFLKWMCQTAPQLAW